MIKLKGQLPAIDRWKCDCVSLFVNLPKHIYSQKWN